ncbi:MAG: hypothetical protein HY270_09705 [Deltaproteobacteria bacterium]|nr:hypothetical protein [Deltaproteobacteria bacterium]
MFERLDRCRGLLLGVGALAATCLLASTALAQFQLSSQRAQDGTVYEIISVPNLPSLFGGAEEVRITTLGGSVNGFQTCSQSGTANQPVKAGSGVDTGAGQALHPLSATFRTTVLNVVDPSNVSFTAIGSGRLVIGSTGNQFEVCRESNYCLGHSPIATVSSITQSDANVPAACVASLTAACGSLTTLGFGLASNGTNCTAMPTVSTTICGPRPTDGFTVRKGQAIVIIYNHSLSMQGFSVGAAGFGVDTDNIRGVNCSGSNVVVNADAQNPSAPARAPLPFQKPAPALSALALVATAMLLIGFGLIRLLRPVPVRSVEKSKR